MHFSVPRSTTIAAFLRRWQVWLLAIITLLAAILRFYRLPEMPPGLFSDEAWVAQMARGMVESGQIEVFYPSNQGAEPFIGYLAMPLIALLGTPIWELRIPVAVVGTLTVPALWWMCREMIGRRSAPAERAPSDDEYVAGSLLGLGSALMLATLFWHINLSRIGMEPILMPLTMCLAFATLARALDTRRMRDYAIAGVALASNLYTYKASYAVPPMAALFVAYTAITEPGFLRREWRNLLVWVGAAVAAYIPMIAFIVTHTDAFFLRFNSVTVDSHFTPQINLADNAIKTLKMFFIEGDENQRYNIPDRPALDPLMAALFVGGVAISLRGLKNARLGFLVVWLFVMSLPTALSEFAPQWGRAVGITPMLAVLSALGAFGLWRLGEWAAPRIGRWAGPAALGAIGVVAIVSGTISVRDYFVTFSGANFLFYSFDEGPLRLSQYAQALPENQRVYVVTAVPESYTLQYIIRRPYVTYNGRNGAVYPPPGQEATAMVILQRTRPMLRAMRAARPDAEVVWDVKDRDGIEFARALWLPASDDPAPEPSHKVEATLGGSIRLLGYDVDADKVRPGERVTLTVYWQPITALDKDYTVFTHLITDTPLPNGEPVLAQADRMPINATYPTTWWAPGETILDQHVIDIPADAPAGVYHLKIGMYLLATLERLAALDSAGEPVPENAIELGPVQVVTD